MVPSDILTIWRTQVGVNLLPVQERAIKEFGLFADGNLIVFSPTSSGKTFVGEMAAVKAARGNTKVLYLVPQKALAAENFDELRRRYSPAGIKVVVPSGGRGARPPRRAGAGLVPDRATTVLFARVLSHGRLPSARSGGSFSI